MYLVHAILYISTWWICCTEIKELLYNEIYYVQYMYILSLNIEIFPFCTKSYFIMYGTKNHVCTLKHNSFVKLGMSNMIHVNLRIADLLTILKITTCTVIVINRKILLPIPWPITLIPFRSMLLLLYVLCTKCIFHIIIHKFSS